MTPTLLATTNARGRIRVVFTQAHTDGTVYGPFNELRPLGTDVTAFMVAHAAALLVSLIAAETADRLGRIIQDGSLAVMPALKFALLNDVQDALRVFYAAAARHDSIMVGDYLSSLTDARLRTIFGMTQAQVTTLRTAKLTPAATLATSIRAAAGA